MPRAMLTSLVVVPFEDGCHCGTSIGVAVGQTQSGREGSLLVRWKHIGSWRVREEALVPPVPVTFLWQVWQVAVALRRVVASQH